MGGTNESTNLKAHIDTNGAATFVGTIIHKAWSDDNQPGLRITSGSSGTELAIKGNGTNFGAVSIRC